jgi:hypothetical protein
MVARIAGFAAEANQTAQLHSVQFGGLLNQINALDVVQDRLHNEETETPLCKRYQEQIYITVLGEKPIFDIFGALAEFE